MFCFFLPTVDVWLTQANDQCTLNVIRDEGDLESSKSCKLVSKSTNTTARVITCVDCCNSALHYDDWKSIHSSQGGNNLPQSRKLSHHVQKHSYQGQSTEIYRSCYTVALSSPFWQNESFRTLLPDDGSQEGKYHQWGCWSNGIGNHALDTGDRSQLWVCKENTWSKSCTVVKILD